MKTSEEILKQEAYNFYGEMERIQGHPIEAVDLLKQRLQYYYSPEYKAIFLNEIKENILVRYNDPYYFQLEEYRIKFEILLFYVTQELDILPTIVNKQKDSDASQRNKVFFSYSHADREYLDDIKRHFKPFLSRIDFWDDARILPGQKWEEEIRGALDAASVAILLVSADFLGSDFIINNELPSLLKSAEEHGCVILTMVLKPCILEEFPLLTKYQTMNPLNRPIIKMDATEREELYVNLVKQTMRVLKDNAATAGN